MKKIKIIKIQTVTDKNLKMKHLENIAFCTLTAPAQNKYSNNDIKAVPGCDSTGLLREIINKAWLMPWKVSGLRLLM